jgi:4-amino-4-deoxy-L-arabinose transferase-like glycosyltransferase
VTGAENLWIARVYSILFWILGGLFLYDLARRLAGIDGAVVSTAFYLLNIFGVVASRSFQPDPLMVKGMLAALWSLVWWSAKPTWRRALVAIIIGGLAIMVKLVAVFMLGPVALTLVWTIFGPKKAIGNRQVWAIAGLMGIIPLAVYLVNGQPSSFFDFWVVKFRGQLLLPSFYFGWFGIVRSITDLGIIFVSLVGLFLAEPRAGAILGGLWLGFVVYGLTFPEQIHTHDYYNLPVVPIIALGMAQWRLWFWVNWSRPTASGRSHFLCWSPAGSSTWPGWLAMCWSHLIIALKALPGKIWENHFPMTGRSSR